MSGAAPTPQARLEAAFESIMASLERATDALSPESVLASLPTDASDRAAALVAFGDLCERLAAATPDRALAACALLAQTATLAHAGSARARILRASVPALAYKGLLAESIVRADEAKTAAHEAGDAIEAARAVVASLHARAKLGRLDEAIALGEEARDALNAANRPEIAARAELNLANLHKIRGDGEPALACLGRALAGLSEQDRVARATVRNTLGETLLQLDRLEEAARAFDEAETDLAAMPLAHAVVVGNRADLRAREGRLGDALREFDRAAQLIAPLAPGHHARLRIEEADALALLGSYGEALDSAQVAVSVASAKGLRAEHARGLLVVARIHAASGRTCDARAAVEECIALATGMGDARMLRYARLLSSELALVDGDAVRATREADEAAQGATPLELARVRVHQARVAIADSRADDALGLAREARTASAALGVRVVEIDALAVEGAAARALGRRRESIQALARAADLTDELRGTLAAERHRVAATTTRLRAYEDLALGLLDEATPDAVAEAFSVVERARSRALVESVLGAIDRSTRLPANGGPAPAGGADSSDAAVHDETLEALRVRLSSLHAALARAAEGESGSRRIAEAERILPSRLDEIRLAERAIDDHIVRRATRAGVSTLFARPLAAAGILSALQPGDALVSYFAAGEELLAFVAFDGALGCVRAIAPVSEIEPLVEKYLFALRASARSLTDDPSSRRIPVSRAVSALSKALHAALLAPILEERPDLARATRLVVVPHGALHGVPFAALHDGSRHLVERFEVHLAASATLACAQDAPCAQRRPMLVVGVSDANAPLIEREVLAVAARHAQCTVLRGADATAARVADAMRAARVVHLACHGRFVDALPNASGLRLADRWMPVREVVELGLDADLVFLSGCETGRHAVDAGDELAGLGSAFLAAGARRLVTSLWPVRDQAAVEIAVEFHRCFSTGMRPSAALRESMLASMRTSPHPSWWAPFAVTGAL